MIVMPVSMYRIRSWISETETAEAFWEITDVELEGGIVD